MTLKEIVLKLTGPIDPVGETNCDNARFENLKAVCELTNQLISAIDDVAYRNKDRGEYSMKRAGEYAAKVLKDDFGIPD